MNRFTPVSWRAVLKGGLSAAAVALPLGLAFGVVSGAGPVGLTLANLLGQSAIGVVVLEKNKRPFDIPRAITLDDEGCRTIQATGLHKKFLPSTIPGKGARYYGEDGSPFAEVGPGPVEFGFPRRTHFFQPKLDQILASGLNRFQQANVFYDYKLIDFSEIDNGIEVEVFTPGNTSHYLFCKYLIGTDGARSDAVSYTHLTLPPKA